MLFSVNEVHSVLKKKKKSKVMKNFKFKFHKALIAMMISRSIKIKPYKFFYMAFITRSIERYIHKCTTERLNNSFDRTSFNPSYAIS
jgi:hypothetical protein